MPPRAASADRPPPPSSEPVSSAASRRPKDVERVNIPNLLVNEGCYDGGRLVYRPACVLRSRGSGVDGELVLCVARENSAGGVSLIHDEVGLGIDACAR